MVRLHHPPRSRPPLTRQSHHRPDFSGNVIALVEVGGGIIEHVRSSSSGTPFGLPAGDTDSDGDFDGSDDANIKNWSTSPYDVRADADLDGDIDLDDFDWADGFTHDALGRGYLSRSDVDLRKGYAGYENDGTLDVTSGRFWHVRHRVLDSMLGRWTRRDPLGYVDSFNELTYSPVSPMTGSDYLGLAWANFDFAWHYFSGGGTLVDLGIVGLLPQYQKHPAISRRIKDIRGTVDLHGQALCHSLREQLDCATRSHLVGETSGTEQRIVETKEFIGAALYTTLGLVDDGIVPASYYFWFRDWTFSIGGHLFGGNYHCIAKAGCCDGHKECGYICSIDFFMDDTYSDPLDLLQTFGNDLALYRALSRTLRTLVNSQGDLLGGTPYRILAGWTDPHPIAGIVDPCPPPRP